MNASPIFTLILALFFPPPSPGEKSGSAAAPLCVYQLLTHYLCLLCFDWHAVYSLFSELFQGKELPWAAKMTYESDDTEPK